jgi:hypothetical protein
LFVTIMTLFDVLHQKLLEVLPPIPPSTQQHNNKNNTNMSAPDEELPPFLSQDLWVHNILPFVGMGHFAFVAGVNHQMKHYYEAYCDTVEDPRATKVDTSYSAVFSSVACAEFWLAQTNNKRQCCSCYVCTLIAKAGNLQVLKWARKKRFPWDVRTCAAAAEALGSP